MKLQEWNNLTSIQKKEIENATFAEVKNAITHITYNEAEVSQNIVTLFGTIDVKSFFPSMKEIVVAVDDAIKLHKVNEKHIVNKNSPVPEERISKEVYDEIILEIVEENREEIIQSILYRKIER
jgi:inorganic pyrophosphatase/exopolyphosphatase